MKNNNNKVIIKKPKSLIKVTTNIINKNTITKNIINKKKFTKPKTKKLEKPTDISNIKDKNIKNADATEKQEKIDIVITYVDSTNPEWQELFRAHTKEPILNNSSRSSTKNRFRNNDELKYCLRSIDKYLNFYRNIYIVMNHSAPKWLKTSHPKIKIINHKEIPDLNQNLPTFNSQAIECNLHKIPDLTDEFLYFNDDMFINAKLDKKFFRDSKINIFLTNSLAPKGNPHKKLTGYYNAWINSNKLLDNNYISQKRYFLDHCPYYVNKNVAFELEKKFKEHYDITTKSKFRELNNINPLCSLLQYHYFYKNIGKFSKKKYSKTIFMNDSFVDNVVKLQNLDNLNPKIFCIEDNMFADKPENIKLIKDFLNKKFPNKSQFEL